MAEYPETRVLTEVVVYGLDLAEALVLAVSAESLTILVRLTSSGRMRGALDLWEDTYGKVPMCIIS